MSRYTHQIIEIKVNGKWQYVPVYKTTDQDHNTLIRCGFVRDVLTGDWYDGDKYTQRGVPEDITKLGREAFVYNDEDYITCNPRHITREAYNALIEHLEENLNRAKEKLFNARIETDLSKRISNLERLIEQMSGKKPTGDKPSETESDYDELVYCEEDYNDALYAYTALCENLAEITALAEMQSDEIEDLRVIMFTC